MKALPTGGFCFRSLLVQSQRSGTIKLGRLIRLSLLRTEMFKE